MANIWAMRKGNHPDRLRRLIKTMEMVKAKARERSNLGGDFDIKYRNSKIGFFALTLKNLSIFKLNSGEREVRFNEREVRFNEREVPFNEREVPFNEREIPFNEREVRFT